MRLSTLSLLLLFGGPGVVAAQETTASGGSEGPSTGDSEGSEEEEPASEEAGPDGETDGDAVPAPADTDLLQAEAIRAPELTENQIRWLKPKRELMYAVPRAQVDFTAYTLEWGEVKVGLANVLVGVAPRVQVGTSGRTRASGTRASSAASAWTTTWRRASGRTRRSSAGRRCCTSRAGTACAPCADARTTRRRRRPTRSWPSACAG